MKHLLTIELTGIRFDLDPQARPTLTIDKDNSMRLTDLLIGRALLSAAIPAHASTVFFDSFESLSQGGGYSYGGTDAAGAAFNPASPNPDYNGSGIQANGSAFGFKAAADGVQTAFIQAKTHSPRLSLA